MKIQISSYGKGKPIVLFHAFPLDNKMWEANLSSLIENGFQVILPNLNFDFENENALSMTAEIIGNELLSLKIKKAIIGGLSLGGYISFNLYRLRPELFAGLILCDTNSSADSIEKKNSRFELIERLEKFGNQTLVEAMLPNLLSDETKLNKPYIFETVKNWILNSDLNKNIAALKAMANRLDHDYILDKINVPTKIIFGQDDCLTDPKIAEKLHNRIPNSEICIIPSAGHYSNIEQADLFNAEILDFVKKIDY